MKEWNKLKELYEMAIKVKPSIAMQILQEVETEEERNFYAFITNMNLQRVQKDVIEKDLF